MDFHEKRILGRTGLMVGRLGVSASYGAPTEAFEEAFDRGANYFYRRHCRAMPRTMLRYAIERFPKPLRRAYMKGAPLMPNSR